jgi:hypothetical protein
MSERDKYPIPQQKLKNIAIEGRKEYTDALKLWKMEESLYDSLLKDIENKKIVGMRVPGNQMGWASGLYKGLGPREPNPVEKMLVEPTYKGIDTVFVRSDRDPKYSENQILSHELGHYFETHRNPKPYSSILHKLGNKLFGEGIMTSPYDTTGWKHKTSDQFDEMFFPIAERMGSKNNLLDLIRRPRRK